MFGRHLREARKLAGLTQEQLAHKAKLDRTYISLLERDLRSPTLKIFFRICQVLGVRPSDLVTRMESKH